MGTAFLLKVKTIWMEFFILSVILMRYVYLHRKKTLKMDCSLFTAVYAVPELALNKCLLKEYFHNQQNNRYFEGGLSFS